MLVHNVATYCDQSLAVGRVGFRRVWLWFLLLLCWLLYVFLFFVAILSIIELECEFGLVEGGKSRSAEAVMVFAWGLLHIFLLRQLRQLEGVILCRR